MIKVAKKFAEVSAGTSRLPRCPRRSWITRENSFTEIETFSIYYFTNLYTRAKHEIYCGICEKTNRTQCNPAAVRKGPEQSSQGSLNTEIEFEWTEIGSRFEIV